MSNIAYSHAEFELILEFALCLDRFKNQCTLPYQHALCDADMSYSDNSKPFPTSYVYNNILDYFCNCYEHYLCEKWVKVDEEDLINELTNLTIICRNKIDFMQDLIGDSIQCAETILMNIQKTEFKQIASLVHQLKFITQQTNTLALKRRRRLHENEDEGSLSPSKQIIIKKIQNDADYNRDKDAPNGESNDDNDDDSDHPDDESEFCNSGTLLDFMLKDTSY